MLDAGTGDTDGITFLESIFANCLGADLSTDDDHRNGVQVSGRNTSNGIGDARATGYQCHANFLGRTGVGIRSMNSGLFMTHKNVLKAVLLEDCVVDIENSTTRVTENVFHAFVRERAHDNICAI